MPKNLNTNKLRKKKFTNNVNFRYLNNPNKYSFKPLSLKRRNKNFFKVSLRVINKVRYSRFVKRRKKRLNKLFKRFYLNRELFRNFKLPTNLGRTNFNGVRLNKVLGSFRYSRLRPKINKFSYYIYLRNKIRLARKKFKTIKRKYTLLVNNQHTGKFNKLLINSLRGKLNSSIFNKLDAEDKFYSKLLNKGQLKFSIIGNDALSHVRYIKKRSYTLNKNFRFKRLYYVRRHFNRKLLKRKTKSLMIRNSIDKLRLLRINRKSLHSLIFKNKTDKRIKSLSAKGHLIKLNLYRKLNELNGSKINFIKPIFSSNKLMLPSTVFDLRARKALKLHAYDFKFKKKVNTNLFRNYGSYFRWYLKLASEFQSKLTSFNKPSYHGYNKHYSADIINTTIENQLNKYVGFRYSKDRFKFNKRRTRFLKYRSALLGRSKYRLFSLINHRLSYLRNQETALRKGRYSLSRFHYNSLAVLDRKRLRGLNNIQGKYVQRKAGYWWKMPRHQHYRWWKLKGSSHLSLFYKRRVIKSNNRTGRNIRFSRKKSLLKVVLKQVTNNYFINVIKDNKTIFMITAGMVGFKGPKRRSWFAAQQLSKQVAFKLLKRGCKKVDLEFRSNVLSKHSKEVLKGLLKVTAYVKKSKKKLNKKSVKRSLTISTLKTIYSRSHNGLRARKDRRL
jgi:ribosomal protein S11